MGGARPIHFRGIEATNGKDGMRGSLHCAAHDETVNGFGRDDGLFGWVRGTSVGQLPAPPNGLPEAEGDLLSMLESSVARVCGLLHPAQKIEPIRW